MNSDSHINVLISLCKESLHQKNTKKNVAKENCESIFQLAKAHRITKPIAKQLTTCFEGKSIEAKKQLESHNQRVTLRMLQLTKETIQLSSFFKTHNLFCLPLKGPVAAFQIYESYTAKDSRDIDLLINENKLDTYVGLLSELNYSAIYPYSQLNTKQKNHFRKVNNQLVLFNPEKKIVVEIHWRLFANSDLLQIKNEELFFTHKTVEIANESVYVFPENYLLFYLIVHGAKHKWIKLYWLHEVAVLVNKTNYDWEKILKEAQILGIDRMVLQAVVLMNDLLDISFPDFLLNKAKKNEKVVKLVLKAMNEILNGSTNTIEKNVSNYWGVLRYKMELKKGLRYKLNHFHLISVHDFNDLKLPEALFGLYYIMRPLLWTKRHLIKR